MGFKHFMQVRVSNQRTSGSFTRGFVHLPRFGVAVLTVKKSRPLGESFHTVIFESVSSSQPTVVNKEIENAF